MGKILAFKRHSDDYEDVVELLREFYAEERDERACGWLEEAVRRAKGILRMAGGRASLVPETGYMGVDRSTSR